MTSLSPSRAGVAGIVSSQLWTGQRGSATARPSIASPGTLARWRRAGRPVPSSSENSSGGLVYRLLLVWQRDYLIRAPTFQRRAHAIGVAMQLALTMAFNVWFVIGPNQQKLLGLVPANADGKTPRECLATRPRAQPLAVAPAGSHCSAPPRVRKDRRRGSSGSLLRRGLDSPTDIPALDFSTGSKIARCAYCGRRPRFRTSH